ncbi:MAG TPA: hypothetical protein VGL81_10650 [Polyangiaceae bacterium]|jgi:hypothetical protein
MGNFHRLLFLALTVLALAAGAAACGSNGGGSNFQGQTDASVSGDGGAGDGPTGFLGDGASFGDGGTAGQGTLAISPQNPTMTVVNGTIPTQPFTTTLTLGGATQTVTSTWALADYTLGAISGAGTFTPQGTIAGTATVIAMYGMAKATTTVTITIDLSAQLGPVTLPDGTTIPQSAAGITPTNLTALQGTPTATDAGTPTTIIYPYDQTVFPLGLLAPVAQFSAGTIAPQDFKISLDTTGFHWDGYGHVGNPAQLQAAIPQPMWDGALASAQPTKANPQAVVVLSIVKAAGGVAYGPAQAHLVIAPGQLTGIIYYESYSSDNLPDGGGTDFGLWAVKPGQEQPPSHLQQGCIICHGVAASGNTITMGTDDPTVGQLTGVYRIETDGGYTQLATSPANLPYPITSIDSRGLGWGTNSPDGKVVLRGLNQFWGGQTLLAWSVPGSPLVDDAGAVQPLSTVMTVNGDFNMFVPEYSVDGNHLVYVTATNAAGAGPAGTPSESIGIVDIATSLGDGGAGGNGAVTLSNPQMIYDSTQPGAGTGAGLFTKVPTFLPDSKSIVFEETKSTAQGTGYNSMLPDYVDSTNHVDGELAMLQPATGGGYVRVSMTNANTGSQAAFSTQNYEPKPLPVQVGGYYWVVFASFRNDAYPTLATPKKLWVTAISPGAAPGTDASHPPFTLVNQAIVAPQQSQRAYWALAPCQGMGSGCQSDSDCCTGGCVPQSPPTNTPVLVCGTPSTGCVATGGRCDAGQSQECCGAAQGVQCIGTLNGYGTCNAPGAAQ